MRLCRKSILNCLDELLYIANVPWLDSSFLLPHQRTTALCSGTPGGGGGMRPMAFQSTPALLLRCVLDNACCSWQWCLTPYIELLPWSNQGWTLMQTADMSCLAKQQIWHPMTALLVHLLMIPSTTFPLLIMPLLWWNNGFRHCRSFRFLLFWDPPLWVPVLPSIMQCFCMWYYTETVWKFWYIVYAHPSHTQKDRKYVVHNHHATYHKMLLQVLALSALSDVFLAWIFMRPWFSHKQHAITIALEPSSNTTQHVAADPQQHHRRRCHPCTSAHHHVKCQNVYVPIHGSHVRLYIRCT